MALSHLIKYVYNTGSDEVIRRGKKIHAIGNVELVEHDELLNGVVFRVKDDIYSTYYKVNVQKYTDPQSLLKSKICCEIDDNFYNINIYINEFTLPDVHT